MNFYIQHFSTRRHKAVLETPKANRLHIAIMGRRNAGKSSLINALTNQDLALVSPRPGTTTDPVFKAMELLPLGPVMFVDTAGVDDTGELGRLRVEKTLQVLNRADVVIIVVGADQPPGVWEEELVQLAKQKGLTTLGVVNKADIADKAGSGMQERLEWFNSREIPAVGVSARHRQGIEELKRILIKHLPNHWLDAPIVGDLLEPGDLVILVAPIDESAPKGRLILPQVQVLREILDHRAMGLTVQDGELKEALQALKTRPRMVITDSQAFARVAGITPADIPLTSFSILYARYKGDLESSLAAINNLPELAPGQKVLIAEGCTHHRQKKDIAQVQIPGLLDARIGGPLDYTWVSGGEFPRNLSEFQLVIHCGACMLNRKEMLHRVSLAREAGVPMVNFGILLAYLHGVLERAIEPLSKGKQNN